MKNNPTEIELFNILIEPKGSGKEAAIKSIESSTNIIDYNQLRFLICNALKNDYLPPQKVQEDDFINKDIRCWLLSALGRICYEDIESYKLVKRHLDPKFEPIDWARYWAIEGLIANNETDIVQLASDILIKDDSLLIKYVAKAILASVGDVNALSDLQAGIKNCEQYGYVLRALRLVPTQDSILIDSLCSFVQDNSNSVQDNSKSERDNNRGVQDNSKRMYEAIIVLGKTKKGKYVPEKVASTLVQFLTSHRWPMYEAERIHAINGLGNLGIEWTSTILIDELTDDSPAIVQAASCALEKVLGIRTTVSRIVESANLNNKNYISNYVSSLRWLERDSVVNELVLLMSNGNEEQQKISRELLQEVGGSLAYQKLYNKTNMINQYIGVLDKESEKVNRLFERSINEARKGFKLSLYMDVTVFLVGIILILASARMAFNNNNYEDIKSWVGVGSSGSLGALGILYSTLIAKPRIQVQESVDHLMNLKVVFLGYLRQLYQIDQAYTKYLLEEKVISSDELSEFSKIVSATMDNTIDQMHEFINNSSKLQKKIIKENREQLEQVKRTSKQVAGHIASEKTPKVS